MPCARCHDERGFHDGKQGACLVRGCACPGYIDGSLLGTPPSMSDGSADASLPPCAACDEVITASKGWVRDAEARPVHLRCSTEVPCPLCAKPIRPKTGVERQGRWVHLQCHTREVERQAMTERDRTSQRIARSRGLIERTRAAIARAKSRRSLCVVCGLPLKRGSGVLFQCKDLVHATCWRAPG
jgi:hypothetical protein